MNYKKTSIILVATTALFIASCNNSDNPTETENIEAATAMTESTNKMLAANAM